MKIVTACMILVLCSAIANAQELRLVLPVGHTSSVSSAAFSKNGKYIVTASWDNTAKIWQASDGRLLYELKGHTASLTAAVFTPDGKLIITSSKDGTARIWTSPEGKLVRTLAGHKNWVNGVTVSANGKQLLTSSWDSTARLWDVRTGRLLKTFSVHSGALTSAVFSADDRLIITASRDSTAAVWDAHSYKMMCRVKHNDWINIALMLPGRNLLFTGSRDHTATLWNTAGRKISTLAQHSGPVTAADFNRDGSLVATASSDSSVCVWNTMSGKLAWRLTGHTGGVVSVKFHADGKSVLTCAEDSTARIWSVTDGEQVAILAGHNGPVNSAVFSNNGKFISTASADNTAKIWDTRNAVLVATLKGHTSVVTSAGFSADGKYMVTASWDNTAKIWDATDGKLLTSLQGHTDWINSVEFSPDGRSVATASSDNTARIWSVPDGRLLHSLKGHSDWVAALSYSPDGKRLITTSWDQSCLSWDVESGIALAELKGHRDMVRSVNFDPTGAIAITASWDHTAGMWNVADGQLIRKLIGHRDKVRTALFSHDGKYILTSSWDSTARIWDDAGELKFILAGHKGPVNAAIFSPDDKYILTSSMDSTVRMWRVSDGALVRVLEGHKHSVNWASYSPDGKQILTSSWDNSPKIWDAATGKLIHALSGHSSSVKSATYDTKGNFIVTTSEDNTLRKWSAETGDFLYSFFSVDSTGFLAIDADGHYDGSESARKLLYYVCGTDIVDIEQFKDLSWEPGLIGKLTGRNPEPITARKLSEIDICNFIPVVQELGFRNEAYHFSILPRRGGVGEFLVFVNGKLVSSIDPSITPQYNGRYALAIPERLVEAYFVADAANMVVVKATTKSGHMISRGASTTAITTGKPASTPNMYVVSIGVSRYKDEKISLRYAAGDAMDFTSLMKSSGEKLLNTDGRQHVFTYLLNTDAETTRKPTKASVRRLIDTIAARATANDIIVIFFAGHGVLQPGQKNLYLLTSEATGFDLGGVAADVAISTDELKEWLRKIRANKQLLILDACNSGQAVQELQAFIGKRDVPADQQRALEHLKDKTGTFILCASAAGQSAYETSMYSQGLLTYSLLAGVKLGTGLRNNRFIDVTKWFQFASDFAKTQARELGARQDPQILGTASFEVGLVDKSVSDAISLPMKKVIFRRSRFIQDDELLSDDLELSVLIDQQLTSLSETSKASPLVFVPDFVSPDSYSIRGKYSITGKQINCRVSVFRGNKERVDQFDLTGSVEDRESFARLIVERVGKMLNKQIAP